MPAVRYLSFPLGNARLLNSRLHTLYGSRLLWRVRSKWKRIDSLVKPFAPQAVVTVTHGYSWLAAAEYALRKDLPLHLLLHDDWPEDNLSITQARPCAQRLLRDYYRAAASRLCISAYMAEVYRNELFAPADVLYPCSDSIAEEYTEPPETVLRHVLCPVVGFGGTVSEGQSCVLRTVAQALAGLGGKLLLYGPMSPGRARALGLDLANIELRGLVSSAEMIRAFRQSADFLLIPQSFLEGDHRQTVMSFPSKIADYSSAGRPLLIVAPEYSSLVRWCAGMPAIAEIVTEHDALAVGAAIKRLMCSVDHRRRLAAGALEVHDEYFCGANAWSKFSEALQRNQTGEFERSI
jgi:hypothetical protein